MSTTPEQIESQEDLANLAARLEVRADWHEPDEQGVNARIVGTHLDNAMGSTVHLRDAGHGEFNVILTQEDERGEPQEIAVVNLATLLAIASGTLR